MRASSYDGAVRFLRRMRAMARFVMARFRFTTTYVALGLLAIAAWAVSMWYQPVATQSSRAKADAGSTSSQTEPLALPEEKGVNNPMDVTTPGSSAADSSQVNVQSDDSGTTVTVNGQTQTVPPGQSFTQSYQSGNSTNTTNTDISVNNDTTSSGSSVNVNMRSSSRSSTSGTDVQP